MHRAGALIEGGKRLTEITVLDRRTGHTRTIWIWGASEPEMIMAGRFIRWRHSEGHTTIEADLLASANTMDVEPRIKQVREASVSLIGA